MARAGRIPDAERHARMERVVAEVGLDVDAIGGALGLSRRQAYFSKRKPTLGAKVYDAESKTMVERRCCGSSLARPVEDVDRIVLGGSPTTSSATT